MGCPAEVEIGDNLVFSVTTHDPDTGVLTDADSVPAYRVYEDETGTAILNGNMAKLDDANTTGFYTESIACTSGNGFETGKTYTIYIAATVDSDQGGISYGFKAYDQRKANTTQIEGSDATDQINAACDASIETYHLDHLLAADYDPASKPGVSTALLNELVENDGGESRFTVNALENGPSGSGASAEAIADAVWDEAQADHTTAGTFGLLASEIADILSDTNELQGDWANGGRLDLLIDEILADVTGLNGDAMRGTDSAYTGTPPTAAAIADAVLDEALSGHTSAGTFGKAVADIEADTNELQSDDVPGLISGLNDIAATDVWAAATRTLTAGTNLNDISVADILTTQMTESYAANGTAPTLAQALFAIHQMLMEFAISGTSLTVKQLDSSTTAFVATLDDGTNPTSITR